MSSILAALLLLSAASCSSISLKDQVWDGSLPLKIQAPKPTQASIDAFLAQPMAAEFHTQTKAKGKIITLRDFLAAWSDSKAPKVATFLQFFLDNEENFQNACSNPGFCSTDQTEALQTFLANLKTVKALNAK